MDFPADLLYTKDHEWVKISDDKSSATLGITEFAQSELGDIVYVDLEDVGDEFGQDDTFGSVEAVKTVAELFMPLSGTITAHNEALEDEPELVNTDPYGDGWMIKFDITDAAEITGLISVEDYSALVAS